MRLPQPCDNPAVQDCRLDVARPRLVHVRMSLLEPGRIVQETCGRRPIVDPRVGHEERVDVPQRDDEAAPGLVGPCVAEEQVLVELLVDEQPAHRVDAHRLRRVVEPDGVAPRFVHRAAILGVERRVAVDDLGRREVLEDGAHRDQAVEPVAELAWEGLADPVGGHPLLPIVVVRAVADGRVGHAAGVKPRVADVLDARHRAAALRDMRS